MRVAYVCADTGVPVFGTKGASVHVQGILRAFLRRGDRVDLHAANVEGVVPEDLTEVVVHPFVPRRSAALRGGGAVPSIDERLAASLAERIRLYDVVYERHALWSSNGMRLARVRGVPGILEVNAPLVDEQLAHRRLLDPAAARRLVLKALLAARLRVAVSAEVARRHAGYGLEEEDFLVCPNGIDPERFRAGAPCDGAPADLLDTGHSRPDFVVGFLGTLKPWHGLEVLVDAFIRLARADSTYRLLIVGDGPLRSTIEERLELAGLMARVDFRGAVDPAEVPRWLARMDVGTAPYASREGVYFSPLKIVEYHAAGVPVVASDAGQVRDLVRHGIDGCLVEPGDAIRLAEAIEAIKADPIRARAMGARGRTQVFAGRTWDSVLERILAAVPEATFASEGGGVGPASTEMARG